MILFFVTSTDSIQVKRCKSYVQALARNIILITVRLIRSKEIPSKVGFRLADKTKKDQYNSFGEPSIEQAVTISSSSSTAADILFVVYTSLHDILVKEKRRPCTG
jgi:hypothetical protein